ncbi:hypothetical protein [Rhizobium etli]|uniref:hypothetical protein n=1 Tax=Rhizobium etli TaxID=29449 RepID=UPI0012BC4192|nr:hypothetical protein [Rhizobium etli]
MASSSRIDHTDSINERRPSKAAFLFCCLRAKVEATSSKSLKERAGVESRFCPAYNEEATLAAPSISKARKGAAALNKPIVFSDLGRCAEACRDLSDSPLALLRFVLRSRFRGRTSLRAML